MKSIFNNEGGGNFSEFIQIYTDGAKRPETEKTGFGVAIPGKEVEISKRSSNKLGVYTVEIMAILMALQWVEKVGQEKVLICSDSLSVLASLRLRLGHCSLNKTLKMIGKHQTGLCEGCQEEESVEHIIMTCKRYETQRQVMKNKLREIGVVVITLKGLLSTVNRIQCRILIYLTYTNFLREAGVFNRIYGRIKVCCVCVCVWLFEVI